MNVNAISYSRTPSLSSSPSTYYLVVAILGHATINDVPHSTETQLWELMRDDSFGQPEESTGGNLKDEKYKEEYIPAARAEKMVGLLLAGQQLPVGR